MEDEGGASVALEELREEGILFGPSDTCSPVIGDHSELFRHGANVLFDQ